MQGRKEGGREEDQYTTTSLWTGVIMVIRVILLSPAKTTDLKEVCSNRLVYL